MYNGSNALENIVFFDYVNNDGVRMSKAYEAGGGRGVIRDFLEKKFQGTVKCPFQQIANENNYFEMSFTCITRCSCLTFITHMCICT